MSKISLRNLKIMLVLIFAVAFSVALLYLFFNFALMWQVVTAGITISLLLIILFLLVIFILYLWMRLLWLKRDLNKFKSEIKKLKEKNKP